MSGTSERLKIEVKFGDTDCTGRVYFPNYVRWIDDAVVEFFKRRGCTFSADGSINFPPISLGGTFVLGEYHCRIEKPSRFGDQIVVEVWPKEVRKRVVTFDAKLTDSMSGDLLATGYISYVYVNEKTWTSADIPEEALQILRS